MAGLTRRGNPRFVEKYCPACNNIFFVGWKKRLQKYCSIKCVWVGTKGAEYNGKIARESITKRSAAQRDRGAGKTYRKFNGRHEHRIVGEQIAGRKLAASELVHHKDENKRNNNPDNLEIVSRPEHMRRHGMGIPGVPLKHKPWEKRWGIK